MVITGGYLLLTRVSVSTGGWQFYGYNAFGLSLFPLLIGIGLLFYDGRSIAGWLLTSGGALIILVGIVANLHIYFQSTSLFDTLMMLGLMAGGVGLVARSLQAGSGRRCRLRDLSQRSRMLSDGSFSEGHHVSAGPCSTCRWRRSPRPRPGPSCA